MLDNQRIIFGGCDAFLHIVNVENGEAIEQYETTAYIPSSVAVYDGIGYSGNYANEVLAFDPGDRGELWVYSDRQFPFSAHQRLTRSLSSLVPVISGSMPLTGSPAAPHGLFAHRAAWTVHHWPLAMR